MQKAAIGVVACLAATAAPALASAASLEVKAVYAKLWVIPEDRADIAVDVRSPDHRLATPVVTRLGDKVVIDGRLRTMNHCNGIHLGFGLPGFDGFGSGSATNITVHVPRDVHLSVNGEVQGEIKPARSLELTSDGCTRWRIDDVTETLSIRQSGASKIVSTSAAEARFNLSGVTDVDMTSARGLDVDMSGVGNVRLKTVSGPVSANLSGMGNVRIAGGHAGRVKADLSGMGGFTFGGAAASLDAEVSGVGGVTVQHVDGDVRKRVSGIGHVSVGR
jgi:hypothetical protein